MIESHHEMRAMNTERPVRDIMTAELITVTPDTGLSSIQNLFEHHLFHHLPVVDKGGVLMGIISREDFYRLAYRMSLRTTGKTWSEKEYQSLRAQDIMTKNPLVLDPDDSIGLAADIFLANRFHALPIVEDNQLVGMVTTHDLLLYSFNDAFFEKETTEML